MGRSRGWRGAAGQDDGVEAGHQLRRRVVHADVDAGAEGDALGRHEVEAAVEDVLPELEVGDAVAQQAADAVGALEDGHAVAGPVELVGGGQAGRAGADDGHRSARALRGAAAARSSPRRRRAR